MKDYQLDAEEHQEKTTYFASFQNKAGKTVKVEIEQEVFDLLSSSQKEDSTYCRTARRYQVGSFYDDLEEYCQAEENDDPEFLVLLHQAIKSLTKTQKRRIYYRFYQNKTIEEIAELEKAGYSSVHESLEAALKKIKKFFKTTR